MPNLTRTFTVAELKAIGVPHFTGATLDTASTEDSRVLDEVVDVDDHGTSQHRRIFRHDGKHWQIYYWDHEMGGVTRYCEPVTATAVEERQVTVTQWLPVETAEVTR
jgi:hypothetical protein